MDITFMYVFYLNLEILRKIGEIKNSISGKVSYFRIIRRVSEWVSNMKC